MSIKKIRNLKENVTKEEWKKRIVSVVAISLGAFLITSSGSVYNEKNSDLSKNLRAEVQEEENIVAKQDGVLKDILSFFKELEQKKMEEKNCNLLSYRVLIENFPDGTVKHHFINDKYGYDKRTLKETDKYDKWNYEYKGITDKNFVVSYSKIVYNTADYHGYVEIPETRNGQYIFDYNVPYYIMKVTDLSLPNGYTFDQLYSINDLKELEEQLDAFIYEDKFERQVYYTFELLLAEVNGEFVCFDFTGLHPEVNETTDVEDVTKLRMVYYVPCVGNYLMNLKISSGMTEVEDYIENISRLNIDEHFVIDDITFLDQTLRNDLRGNTVAFQNLYGYLTEINGYADTQITKEELDELLEELNEQNVSLKR